MSPTHRTARSGPDAKRELGMRESRFATYNRALVELARSGLVQGAPMPVVFARIVEVAAQVLGVERASLWRFDETRSAIVCLDLFELSASAHSSGMTLRAVDYPAYFAALEGERVIAAHDAQADPRSREFTAAYLEPLGITSMLDAPVFVGGVVVGTLCNEHVGPPRRWSLEDESFAASLADFVSLVFEADARAQAEARLSAAEAEKRVAEGRLFLAQKMEAVGRLAGGIAHDFNNLLTVILGHCSLLRAAAPRGAGVDEALDEIESAGRRAAELTGQLLAFSSRQVMNAKIVDLRTVVEGIAPTLRRLIGEAITLEILLPEEPICVHADPGQLGQVVLNLAINARDAMEGGGTLVIEVGVAARRPDAARGASEGAHDPQAVLAVSDTGAGIPEDIRDRIFEPFFTTKGEGRSFGLGLSTVYGIVQQSGGGIVVTSRSGGGTRFEVFLPRVAEPASVPLPPAGGDFSSGRGEGVLVVEDEEQVRTFLVEALEHYGYRVESAATPNDALAAVERAAVRPAVLVSDMVLPGMDGGRLAKLLMQRIPELRVVFVSGYPSGSMATSVGDAFLAKPFSPARLAAVVREVLDARAR